MSSNLHRSRIGAGDRLSLTLFFAAAVHSLVIFGVSFSVATQRPPQTSSLDVILVQSPSDSEPEDAKYIAQTNQRASGRTEEEQQPSQLTAGLSPAPVEGRDPIPLSNPSPAHAIENRDFIAQPQKSPTKVSIDKRPSNQETADAPSEHELTRREQEIAELAAELAKNQRQYAQRPRINYVDTLSAKTAVEASYLKEWIGHVEQVGNLNYPDAARRNQLSGSLILHVLLDHGGRLLEAKVGSPSGQQVLDDAALRIVKLASPFKPFPDEMRQSYDQLMITRTWVFRSGNSLITR